MTTADTLLFLGLIALAYWLEDARLQAMAGAAGIAAGLGAIALAPAPWVGLVALGMGVYLVVAAIRTLLAVRRTHEERR